VHPPSLFQEADYRYVSSDTRSTRDRFEEADYCLCHECLTNPWKNKSKFHCMKLNRLSIFNFQLRLRYVLALICVDNVMEFLNSKSN